MGKEIILNEKLKEEIFDAGIDTARLWGAECLSFEVNFEDKVISFTCIEHGEMFNAPYSFKDFKDEYNIDLEALI